MHILHFLFFLFGIIIALFHGRESRRDDGYGDFFGHILVDARAENNVRGIIHDALYQGARRTDLFIGKISAADNVDDDARRALDGRFEQRAVHGETDGLDHSVFALGDTDAHVRQALVLQNGFDVGKVEVDERGFDDQFGDAADTLTEHLVRIAERLLNGRILGHDRGNFIVGNNDQRIDVFFEVFQALDGVIHPLLAFKTERLGDDRDGQDLHVLCDLRNDGRGARTRTAAHACRDEQKVRALDGAGKFLFALFGGLSADFGIGAGAETARQLRTDLYFGFAGRKEQHLVVGVDADIFRARHPRFDHSVDGIAAGTPDADDLDLGPRQLLYIIEHILV